MSLFSLLSLSWLFEVFYSLVCDVACYVVLYGADVFSGLFLDAAAFPQCKGLTLFIRFPTLSAFFAVLSVLVLRATDCRKPAT